MILIIVLIGESASGKSTIEKELASYGYNKIVSYTTRPPRKNEINGIDYHFVTEEHLKKLEKMGHLAEKTVYRNWHYGISINDCKDNTVVVVEPNGFRQLQKIKNISITSFYIKTSERKRLIRMAKRGDEIMEIFRRVISDQGVFQGIGQEVDYVIDNDGDFTLSMKKILLILDNLKK